MVCSTIPFNLRVELYHALEKARADADVAVLSGELNFHQRKIIEEIIKTIRKSIMEALDGDFSLLATQ